MRKEIAQKLIDETADFDENCIALGDLTETPWFGTPEEEISKWPIREQIEFEAKKQEFFSTMRQHGIDGSIFPFAVGGSDAGTILGYNDFMSPSVLYEHKKYPAVYASSGPEDETLAAGHRAEGFIMGLFSLATGLKVIDWTVQMVNEKWPHCVANVDGLVEENGLLGIYEGKCPQIYSTQKDWMQIKKLGNKPECISLVPMKYRCQVWFYLAVTGLSFAYICAGGWGFRKDDIAYVRIDRLPEEEENALMQACELFVRNTARGNRPSDVDYADKNRLLKLYNDMYLKKKLSDEPVKLLPAATPLIETIRACEEKKEEINKQIKELEKELGLKEVEAKITAAKAALAEMMYTSKYGVATDAEGNPVRVTYELSYSGFKKELCQEKYPEIFKEVYGPSRRVLKIG